MGYMRDLLGRRLDSIIVPDQDELATQVCFLEARTGGSLAFSAAGGVNVIGMAIRVPASPRPMNVPFEISFLITAVGGGFLGVNMYEVSGQAGALILRGAAKPERIESTRPLSSGGTLVGTARMPASDTPRMLGANLSLTRDAGSALAASMVYYDNDYYRPIIEVAGR